MTGKKLTFKFRTYTFECWPLPPYVHLASTHVMNAPRPSPLFAGLPLPCIIVNANGRLKRGKPRFKISPGVELALGLRVVGVPAPTLLWAVFSTPLKFSCLLSGEPVWERRERVRTEKERAGREGGMRRVGAREGEREKGKEEGRKGGREGEERRGGREGRERGKREERKEGGCTQTLCSPPKSHTV